MAKRKRAQARVPATKAAPVASLPDPRAMESVLASIGRGAAHYASNQALLEAQGLMYEAFGHFWGILETRPYMRARAALAETLWALDRREEAVEHHRELLRLNPNDNQGLRDRQVEWLLWLERYEELDALFAAYDEDAGAAFAYTKALAAFRREGASAGAGHLLDDARKANPHVAAYLTGRK